MGKNKENVSGRVDPETRKAVLILLASNRAEFLRVGVTKESQLINWFYLKLLNGEITIK